MKTIILSKIKWLFSFAGIAILMMTLNSTAFAVEETLFSANVDLGAGFGDFNCDNKGPNFPTSSCESDVDENYRVFEGDARANVPLGVFNMAMQFDMGGFAYFTDREESDDQLHSYVYFGGHLAYRDPESFAAGVFGSVGSAGGGEDEDAQHWLIGGEVQKYFNSLTLYLQGGFFEGDDESEDDLITNAYFVRGVIRYFLAQSTMISLEAAYADGEENDDPTISAPEDMDDIKALSWRARGEHAFNNGPISAFLDYHGTNIEAQNPNTPCCEDNLIEHVFLVGFKFTFGTKTLLHHDRYGATFSQPDVGRWTGWTLETVD